MLTSNVMEGSNTVTMTYDGPLHAEEMVAVRERLTTVVCERGSARLLVEYGTVDLGRVEPRAMWEDLRTAGVPMAHRAGPLTRRFRTTARTGVRRCGQCLEERPIGRRRVRRDPDPYREQRSPGAPLGLGSPQPRRRSRRPFVQPTGMRTLSRPASVSTGTRAPSAASRGATGRSARNSRPTRRNTG
jgi:hypothetical protein